MWRLWRSRLRRWTRRLVGGVDVSVGRFVGDLRGDKEEGVWKGEEKG